MKAEKLFLSLALLVDFAFGFSAYLNQLSNVPQQTVQKFSTSNPAGQSQPQQQQQQQPVRPYNNNDQPKQEKKPVTPFVVPPNVDSVLGYRPSRGTPRNGPTHQQQQYAPPPRPDERAMQRPMSGNNEYWSNKYAGTVPTADHPPRYNRGYQGPAPVRSRLNDNRDLFQGNPNYSTHHMELYNNRNSPTIEFEGKQLERYRPNRGYNSYNGYHYRDNYGTKSRFNEYNNPFNDLYYRDNYNQFNGHNNVDFSGGMYYYDHTTGRQYKNYERNNHNNNNNAVVPQQPKYFVNKKTGVQHRNPMYDNGNLYWYSGKTPHSQRQESIYGVMDRF